LVFKKYIGFSLAREGDCEVGMVGVNISVKSENEIRFENLKSILSFSSRFGVFRKYYSKIKIIPPRNEFQRLKYQDLLPIKDSRLGV
jgi:hypothetical protein